ncbi:hypothetical protein J6590_027753, partial [Homalodisca vitripennis]
EQLTRWRRHGSLTGTLSVSEAFYKSSVRRPSLGVVCRREKRSQDQFKSFLRCE